MIIVINQCALNATFNITKKEDDDDNDSVDSWWSVNHPIEAQELYHSAKLMLDDIEHDGIFIESMIYYKTFITV